MIIGTGLVGAPACGDVMKLQIEVDGNNKITKAVFKTFGCGSAIGLSQVYYYSTASSDLIHFVFL
jgi:NifU-like protein involved in Fe-S cluster formation